VTIGGVPIATNHRGDGIGEIALLYGVPRTATVTAASPAIVFALSRPAFQAAVTGHTPIARATTAIADERLNQDRPRPTVNARRPQPNNAPTWHAPR
jgi:CRP-like cAMP-binding protein